MPVSLLLFFSAVVAPPTGPAPVNAVLGDRSAQVLRPGELLDEATRITVHLTYVEDLLRSRPTAHLAPDVRARRAAVLDRLATYRERGAFPINTYAATREPVFVDATGRRCAVAALAEPELGRAAIEGIADRQRLAYIGQIEHLGLATWARDHGFTTRELAMIQPSYAPPVLFEVGSTKRPQKRVQARFDEDWQFCAGAAFGGNARFALPTVESHITFHRLREHVRGRVELERAADAAPDEDGLFSAFSDCVRHRFGNRRFPPEGIDLGRPLPVTAPFSGSRLTRSGAPTRPVAAAVMAYVAETQGTCFDGSKPAGRWRLKATFRPKGKVRGISARPRGRAPNAAETRACLEATLKSQLDWAFPEASASTAVTIDLHLGARPGRVEPRMVEQATAVDVANHLLWTAWRACATARYPAAIGFTSPRFAAAVDFRPDGKRMRMRLGLTATGETRPTDAAFARCVTRRFERWRVHPDGVWPGQTYALGAGVFGEDPVSADGRASRVPLEAHVADVAEGLADVCPPTSQWSGGWVVRFTVEPGGQLADLRVEPDRHSENDAGPCVAEALRARLRLPPVTAKSEVETRIRIPHAIEVRDPVGH